MNQAKTLMIKWQRLLSDGKTCPRCQSTGDAVEKAVTMLGQSLAPMGIKVVLEKGELSEEEFKQNPLHSNKIWIGGQLLEDWLGATTGQSVCCEVCGANECRTFDVAGESLEIVPTELIVKAGMLAVEQLLPSGERGCCHN